MIIKDFASSPECEYRGLCGVCRGDAGWRDRIGAPTDCPHGVTLADLPPPVDPNALSKTRQKQCDACPLDCTIKTNTPCHRRRLLNREQFHCPDGKF